MGNQRSPNCPQITFLEAAEKGRLVYEREHTHPSAKEVVVQSLGYSGINGRSLSMIGALRQYGILEGTGDALRITDDAVTYFELEDGEERNAALLKMLFNPPFFEQIRGAFPDQLPSEANLRHYLIKHGFLPDAAANVIRVYRENIRLVGDSGKRYTEAQHKGEESMLALSTPSMSQSFVAAAPHHSTAVPLQPVWSQSFALSKGTKAELTIKGDVTQEGLALLKTYIELTIRALADDTTRDEKDSDQGALS
jgi:hypothetical protein